MGFLILGDHIRRHVRARLPRELTLIALPSCPSHQDRLPAGLGYRLQLYGTFMISATSYKTSPSTTTAGTGTAPVVRPYVVRPFSSPVSAADRGLRTHGA